MDTIDLRAFDYIFSRITDGFLFERFAQSLLSLVVGVEFVPLGGVKDRALDGLDHSWSQRDELTTVYQISIQADSRTKILNTITALKKYGIKADRLFYVTNQEIREQDKLMEDVYKDHKIILQCRPIGWLRANVRQSEATVRLYAEFIRDNAHQLPIAGPEIVVKDYAADPRVFVFLRQQLDSQVKDSGLRNLLVDSLILYGLEGTDPDKNLLRSRDEILATIKKVIKFPIDQIQGLVAKRLDHLSSNPRQINYHGKENKYCLPYETRLRLDQLYIRDSALSDTFTKMTEKRLSSYLDLHKVTVSRPERLLSQTINQIFQKQGLDFSDFVLHQKDPKAVESRLPEVIESVLESSGVPPTIRLKTALALQGTIREIIYHGSEEELEYLQKLSRTYMLLFMVQCEPHVCSYFDSLAAQLKVFVCNSILVPALSEIGLPSENRRHWNLLLHARNAGVNLFVNKVTVEELLMHIRGSVQAYDEEYKALESFYTDESTLPYVQHILIRAYLYSKGHDGELSFDEFIDQFVSPRAPSAVMFQELVSFLRDEFKVAFIDDRALGVEVDRDDLEALNTELKKTKRSSQQAENDARTILSIYAMRERDNESGAAGIFGFKTWWLSKDTLTFRAVSTCFKDKHLVSCYLRPDFLLNYIALSARRGQATKVFDQMFPTLIGVSLSHHVSKELSHGVHEAIDKHRALSPSRVRAIMGSLSTQLMTDGCPKGARLEEFLEEEFKKSGKG